MRYSIKIEDQTFTVEIEDLNVRPIVAIVDGERFEVWPENDELMKSAVQTGSTTPAPVATAAPAARPIPIPSAPAPSSLGGATVRAPIPGVIVGIHVKPGDEVKVGQELCTIEAMKMKNAIKANRNAIISEVLVAVGQTVNHNAPLVSFTE